MTHFVDTAVEPAVGWMADWSLRWAVLCGLAALTLGTLRPRRAATRQLTCRVALVGGLLLPILPRWGAGWYPLPPVSEPVRESLPEHSPSLPRTSEIKDRPREKHLPAEPIYTASDAGETTNEPVVERWGSRRILVAGAALGWGFGVLVLLIRRLAGGWFLRRLRREAVAVGAAEEELFVACRAEMGVRGRVRLAAHRRVRSPVLLGVLRPLILVPLDWGRLAADVQRGGLLHELAHVRRRDHCLTPLLETVRVAFFFHPLVRWLLARLDYERELLCDEMVVVRGVDRRDYAHMLLEFARASGRFALPGMSASAYLPVGRGRTVKARINHLLEENMERWIGSLPARWAIVMGGGLLALTLGLASYRVRAVEPEKPQTAEEPEKSTSAPKSKEKRKTDATPSKPPVAVSKREALRYGGKNFDEWRTELVTELKPSIRMDGLKALGAFGANGYAAEATQAIAEMMRSYDVRNNIQGDDDGKIAQAALSAVQKIGPDALPGLLPGVKADNRNTRLFALYAFRSFGTDARSAVPALLEAIKHKDPETRNKAIDAVRIIDPRAKEFVSLLIGALKDEDETVRRNAVLTLAALGEQAEPAIPALVEALRDKSSFVRGGSIATLQTLGAGAKAVPAVSRLLEDKGQCDNLSHVENGAWNYLHNVRPEEIREAIPALIAVLQDERSDHRSQAAELLGNIGPAAKEAIPALTHALSADEQQLVKTTRVALKKIKGK